VCWARRRHYEYHVTLVARLDSRIRTAEATVWAAVARGCADNLRTAVSYAIAQRSASAGRLVADLYWPWFLDGFLAEGRDALVELGAAGRMVASQVAGVRVVGRPCQMASTSAVAVWRLALLIGAPLAFAVTGTLHLVPASGSTVGSDFDHVVPHSSLWTGIHVVQLVIISLLALAVAVLTQGLSDPGRSYPGLPWCRSSRSIARSMQASACPVAC
jgi:hypothetical protein